MMRTCASAIQTLIVYLLLCTDFAGNLLGCVDVNTPIPLERWDADAIEAPSDILASNMLRFGAFMPGIDRFDDGAFRLAKAEAVAMDPQCRVLLEHTFACLQVCLATRVVQSQASAE